MTKLLLIVLTFPSSPSTAQTPTIVRSTTVDATSVTVYRNPHRSGGGELDLTDLGGFALISETRTISLPQGAATIRFEGVADGMIAVSALVTGLPGGVVQKNRDAALLSPASLLDGSLGNRVHLRRTSRATGAVTEQDAIVRSGPDGALIFQTSEGLEALRCSGIPETILYDSIPSGLGDTPVLSVDTVSESAQTATVTLTYLATGFDWSADYVMRLADDSDRADLFGWMTIANGNRASFADATLLAIAGTLNVDSDYRELAGTPPTPELQLTCYPLDGTSTITPEAPLPVPAPPPSPGYDCDGDDCYGDDIVVTAQRVDNLMREAPMAISAVTATEESIGNLRLFRVPFRTTVAAEAQKQIAFMDARNIRARRFYFARADPWRDDEGPIPLAIALRLRNRTADGLGRSLPAGSIAIFSRDGRLLGGDNQRDLTTGEDFDLAVADSPQVTLIVSELADTDSGVDRRQLAVTNANPFAISVEISIERFDEEEWQVEPRARRRIAIVRGVRTWVTRIPANGTASLTLTEIDD